jgi:hypothetical protein
MGLHEMRNEGLLGIPGEEFSGDERSDESCGEDRRLSSGRYGLYGIFQRGSSFIVMVSNGNVEVDATSKGYCSSMMRVGFTNQSNFQYRKY